MGSNKNIDPVKKRRVLLTRLIGLFLIIAMTVLFTAGIMLGGN